MYAHFVINNLVRTKKDVNFAINNSQRSKNIRIVVKTYVDSSTTIYSDKTSNSCQV
jgi:hypothetical protein